MMGETSHEEKHHEKVLAKHTPNSRCQPKVGMGPIWGLCLVSSFAIAYLLPWLFGDNQLLAVWCAGAIAGGGMIGSAFAREL